jgi:pseudouridylate synthase
MSIVKDLLRISPEVASALKHRKPVVALESTIISHGMPYPSNRQCALEVEHIVRQAGAVPATVALMHGQICVGLAEADIEELAQSKTARKVSRRDIPFVLAQRGLGSTTVAGTMICSALAGIDVFVTGGLGGVHRDFAETMDVSADLRELGRTPVAVVSAGVKNILDIPRTLEFLETEGVPVITYGSKYFPAFFSPSSGVESPFSLDSIADIARVLAVRKQLNLQNGVLVGVPADETPDGAIIESAIKRALREAHEQGVKGAATTPFLLKKVHEYSHGGSIKANINLIKKNAQIGS